MRNRPAKTENSHNNGLTPSIMRPLKIRLSELILHGSALCIVSILASSGCAVFFSEDYSLAASVQLTSAAGYDLKAVLRTTTRYIEFDGLQNDNKRSQHLQISVVNRGRSAFLAKQADGTIAPVAPGANANLYNGETSTLTNALRIAVSALERRTPCDFHVEFSPPLHFNGSIKLYLFNSSAPM